MCFDLRMQKESRKQRARHQSVPQAAVFRPVTARNQPNHTHYRPLGTRRELLNSAPPGSRQKECVRAVGALNCLSMDDGDRLRETEEFFYRQIPITRAMGVRVTGYDGNELSLAAPVALNHNHLGTAFGGSLSASATLAGYGLLWLELDDKNCHLVIRRSSLAFNRPVRREIVAICRRPRPEELAAFKATFAERGKARIDLKATIEEAGVVAVEFSGTFVALR
jgi:thioesterase domain-containing protein